MSIWSDSFTWVPAAPRYVVEKPTGQTCFSANASGLKVTYKAERTTLRAEIQPRTDPDNKVGIRLPKRTPLYFGTRFCIKTPSQKSKIVLLQWYQTQKANPPLSLELVGSELRLVRLWCEGPWPGTNPNREIVWTAKIARDVWYELEVNAVFDSNPLGGGHVAVVFDGEQFQIPGPNCYGDDVGILPKLGIYRPGAKDGTVPLGQVTTAQFSYWQIA